MTAAFPDNAFWDWSVAVYGRPGVASACLALQERHGLDVNVLLFCCWTASRGAYLPLETLKPAVAEVEEWHREAVRPLRAVRQSLKRELAAVPRDLAETVRQRVGAAELEAEHLEQILLSRHAPAEILADPGQAGVSADPGQVAEAAAAHLVLYAALSPFGWTPQDADPLRDILRQVVPECPPERAALLAAAIPAASAA